MAQLVEELLNQLKSYKVIKVEEVVLQIGDLAFLGEEQMKFAWKIVTKECEQLKGSKLTIERIPAETRCKSCGYTGEFDLGNGLTFHDLTMVFGCPRCEGEIEIMKGRECIIKNVSLEVEE
jgi:hydrogenase nickel insertion protein HypA